MGLYERVAVRIPGTKRYRYRWRRKLLIRDWLFGNVTPIREVPKEYREGYAEMLYAAARAGRSIRRKLEVSSSFRSRREQLIAWLNYQSGKGPVAARPGRSLHEIGRALDFPDYKGEPGLRDDDDARRALVRQGFLFDVASEGWHASYYG